MGLDEITGDENLVYGISELLNAMTELSRLAEQYHLEGELYHSLGGLGKVQELIGETRLYKLVRKRRGLSLSNQEKWDRIAQSLQDEFLDLQEIIIMDKASQPICSVKPEMTYQDKSDEGSDGGDCDVSVIDDPDPMCLICGKKGHNSYVSPFTGK